MGSRIDKTMRGIFIPHSKCVNADNLADNDAAASNSDYTQGGSRPGSALTTDAFARLVPQLSGEQGSDQCKVHVMSGGNPGKGDGAPHILIRTDATGEADADYRGWNPPVFLNGWDTITWGETNAQAFDVAVLAKSQRPIVVYTDAVDGGRHAYTRLFDFDASPPAWDTAVQVVPVVNPQPGAVYQAVSILALPETERIIVFVWGVTRKRVDAYFSDDDGTTWAIYSVACTIDGDAFGSGSANDADRMRTAYHNGDIVMFLEEESATGDLTQFASNSLGTRFTKVEARSAFGHQVSTFSLPDGSGIGMVYRDQSANTPNFIRISSAYQATSESTAINISATTVGDLTAYADYDGIIYVFGRDTAVGKEDLVHTWFSLDNGDTWSEFDIDPFIGSPVGGGNLFYSCGNNVATGDGTGTHIKPGASCAVRGHGLIIHDWAANPGTNDTDIGAAWGGGWSNVTADHGEVTSGGLLVVMLQMMGWGLDGSSSGRTWIPIELPQNLSDWTLVNTAGVLTEDGMTITVSATNGYVTRVPTTPFLDMSTMFEVEVTSVGTAALTVDRIAHRLRLANGTDDLDVSIRFDDTGFRVQDNNAPAQVGSDVAVTGTVQVAMHLELTLSGASGEVSVWWRTPLASKWTVVADKVAVTNDTGGPDGGSLINWGNITAGTCTSRWKQFHYRSVDGPSGTPQHLGSESTNNIGKSMTALPYPIPDLGTSAGEAFMAVRSGPGRVGDAFTIDPTYDHPVEAMLPGIEPSPKTTWRSSSTAEQRFSFDLTDNTFLGSYSIGLYLDGINFRKATLEGWNGSSWTTLGTFDGTAGFTTVSYVLAGDILSPNTSSGNDGSRFVQTNEFVGGHVLLGTEGAADPREILQNSGGVWTSNDTVLPKFRLDGIDGGEAASGAGETNFRLCAPRGLLVVHLADDQQYSKFQVTIPASQDTPTSTKTGGTSGGGDWYECGVMMLGYLGILGKQHSRSWQQRLVPNVETTSVQGTIRTREISEMIEEWTWSWVNTADMRKIRNSTDLDFYASSEASKAALVADQDVFWALKGYMRDAKSGEYPVVAMSAVTVTSGTTITDPSLILYGSLTSAIQGTHVVGDEASGEVYRIEPITVRGIK